MAHERKPAWHTAREFATHWLVGGAILAATGFVPEEWLARVLDGLRVPADALHLWGSGIDLRVALVGLGCGAIVGDVAWRNFRRVPAVAAVAAVAAEPRAAQARPVATPADPPAPPAALPLPDRPSIAVLPFANMSGDPEQEYFSDGVADDVITELSRSRSLFVIARNSSFTYRGKAVDVRQVSRELGVRYVLEGSVRREGAQLRVNAQLIDAETGSHIWAERYDRDVRHVFAVQDEITRTVAAAILPAVGEAEQRRVLRKTPENLTAWETYQRGLWFLAKSTPQDNLRARAQFHRAAEIDPGFARAYAHEALTWVDEAVAFGQRPPLEASALALPLARQAVALDPGDGDAQSILAFALSIGGDLTSGLACAERALAINRNSAAALWFKGAMLVYTGHHAEGRALLLASLRLDPHHFRGALVVVVIALSCYWEHDYAAAVDAARRGTVEYPGFAPMRRVLAAALGQIGRREEAEAALREAIAAGPQAFETYVRNRPPWYRPEDQEHILDGLRKAGWQG